MSFEHIVGAILQLIDTIFVYINSLVYNFISFLYQIFPIGSLLTRQKNQLT